jgi:hypothetical protein
MNNLSVRLAKPEDAKNYSEWLKRDAKINYVDPKTVSYRSSFTAVVDQDDKPSLMQTAHPVLMLEAIATNPDNTAKQNALAIVEMLEAMKRVAKDYGIQEIYFASEHKPLQKMAEEHPELGATPVTLQMYRIKL